MNKFDLNLAWWVEAKCILFLNGIALKANMQVLKFDLNQIWQDKANWMSFISWNRVESRHVSDQARFQTKQANWSELHVIHGWKQVKSEHASKWSSQFETNLASWS